jgi:hypothetical protein
MIRSIGKNLFGCDGGEICENLGFLLIGSCCCYIIVISIAQITP